MQKLIVLVALLWQTVFSLEKATKVESVSHLYSHTKKVSEFPVINYLTIKRQMNLVVPIRWADHTERQLPEVGVLHQLFNNENKDANACPSGSVRMYYRHASYNQHDIQTEIWSDWLTSSNNETYFADGVMGLKVPKDQVTALINDALVDILDKMDASYFEFNQFDKDGDGEIDSIMFLHSGYNAEDYGKDCYDTASMDRIHTQKRTLLQPWVSNDGIKIEQVYLTSGLWGICGSRPTRIGRLIENLGLNLMGLESLGDASLTGRGLGGWDVMSDHEGFDNSDWQKELYPTMFSAYNKIKMGFVKTINILDEGLYQANNSYYYPAVFKITEGFPDGEYLLLENKYSVEFDKNIPGNGLAIYHVDEKVSPSNNRGGYPGKPGQNYPESGMHYKVSLVQADGLYGLEVDGANNNWRLKSRGDEGDLFYANGVDELKPSTWPHSGPFPNSDAYQQGSLSKTLVRIYDISAPGEIMTFKVQFNAGTPTDIPTIMPTDVPTIMITTNAPVESKNPTFKPTEAPIPMLVDPVIPTYERPIPFPQFPSPTRFPTHAFTMLPTMIIQANGDSSSNDEGLDAGASAGVAIAVIIFVAALSVVGYFAIKATTSVEKNTPPISTSADPQVTVTVDNLYPDVDGENANQSPGSPREVLSR